MGKFSDVLLTVDYDRTLTAPDSSIPERNLEAIRYFMENDGAFTVNTGRSVPMIQAFRDRVPVNAPLLLYNGSAAYDLAAEKLLFCHEIQLDMWQTVRECMTLFPDLTCRDWTPTTGLRKIRPGTHSATTTSVPGALPNRETISAPS